MEKIKAEFRMNLWMRIKSACIVWWGIVITKEITCYEESKITKAIEKIKKGIECPEFDTICNEPMFPDSTMGLPCKDDPELAFHTGFEMAVLECGEILAKAQDDDK